MESLIEPGKHATPRPVSCVA